MNSPRPSCSALPVATRQSCDAASLCLQLRCVRARRQACAVRPLARKMMSNHLELNMKKPVAVESASALIDAKINELGDWRGKTLAKVRAIIHAADPEILEEVKWRGVPVFSHGGIICTGETYKSAVKLTFAKGAALDDPAGLFNSSLEGNTRRAIDIHEGEKINEKALEDLIRAAVALNVKSKTKPAAKAKKV